MDVASVTVAMPVSDLAAARSWYETVFELGSPDLTPLHDVVEYRVGPIWLQLFVGPTGRTGAQVTFRAEVPDVAAQHRRLAELGVPVGPLEHVEGAVDHFVGTDPDGNALGFYSMLA
jgi:predicted enzyme related to lactoylglutathione lyase